MKSSLVQLKHVTRLARDGADEAGKPSVADGDHGDSLGTPAPQGRQIRGNVSDALPGLGFGQRGMTGSNSTTTFIVFVVTSSAIWAALTCLALHVWVGPMTRRDFP